MAFAGVKRRQRQKALKKLYLIEMTQMVLWHYVSILKDVLLRVGGSRLAYLLIVMLRLHTVRKWFGYADFLKFPFGELSNNF